MTSLRLRGLCHHQDSLADVLGGAPGDPGAPATTQQGHPTATVAHGAPQAGARGGTWLLAMAATGTISGNPAWSVSRPAVICGPNRRSVESPARGTRPRRQFRSNAWRRHIGPGSPVPAPHVAVTHRVTMC